MAWMPCNMQHEIWIRCVRSALFVAPMKSSTDNYLISMSFYGMVGCWYVGIMTLSNLCLGILVVSFNRSDMMSLAVSDPAHKKCVDLHHTIFNAVGTTSYVSPRENGQPSEVGRTWQKFHACRCDTTRFQKPSAMSSLEQRKGESRLQLYATTAMGSFSVETSCPIESWGYVFTVAYFTDEIYLPFTQMRKEISRITQYWRILWGIQAAGENLILGRSLSLIVLYFRILKIFSEP